MSLLTLLKPAAAMAKWVVAVRSHRSAMRAHGRRSIAWTRASPVPGSALMCSTNRNRPPGLRMRRISLRAVTKFVSSTDVDGDNFFSSKSVFFDEFLYFCYLGFFCLRKIKRRNSFDVHSQGSDEVEVAFDAVEISFFRAARELEVIDKVFVFNLIPYF